MGALIVCRDLEGAAGPGRVLLEDEDDVAAAQPWQLGAVHRVGPQLTGPGDQVEELQLVQVEVAQQRTRVASRGHGVSLVLTHK